MNKYKIKTVMRDKYTSRIIATDGKSFTFDNRVIGDVVAGDVLYEYMEKDTMFPIAYACNERLQLNILPNSNREFKDYASEHLTWAERMRLNSKMRQVLKAQSIEPEKTFEKNLRRYMATQRVR